MRFARLEASLPDVLRRAAALAACGTGAREVRSLWYFSPVDGRCLSLQQEKGHVREAHVTEVRHVPGGHEVVLLCGNE